MLPTPTALYPLTLPALLRYILTTQADTCPTLLIICASRDTFVQDLATSLLHRGHRHTHGLEQLLVPTLHNLLTARHVRLAFCASVQALLAYLTAYRHSPASLAEDADQRERVILVNPLALHAPTSSFSAQGLSRCFAAAADVALQAGVTLHIAECEEQRERAQEHENEDTDTDMEDDHQEPSAETQTQDPWEQQVSILNVSARRFGSGSGERAWAGRTVKAKLIAARWFRFHNLESQQTHADQA
ncbi:hypothetical protein G6011_04663 [Alternaria panax]|uniref:Uncharacterized protein n=1 Tax=Alternaria panax TaxID=48097 RepID=A0AAD4IGY1_9PLEO|nr:hypothetical protein G6011_04663 [Alternaria panax]